MVLSPWLLAILTVAAPASIPEARFDHAARTHLANLLELAGEMRESNVKNGPLPLAALRALLAGSFRSDAAVLVYSYSPSEQVLDAWLVGADGIRASASTPVTAFELAEKVAALQMSLGAGAAVAARAPRPRGVQPVDAPASTRSAEAAIREMEKLLLPLPIASALGPVRELFVAPTLAIGAVPFAALAVDGRPLIDARTITVLPNVYGLGAVDAAARQGPLYPALVVGNPDLSGDLEWEFPPLPGAVKEASFAAEVIGAEPLIGKEATRAAVLQRAAGAQLLYLATHGVADPYSPLDGFLALSGPRGADRLTAREIQSLKLPARLAVLSACQTGIGRGLGGGVVSIARAFQLAGVRNVVMSLWNVDDDATTALMRDFLDAAWTKKEAPAEALRHAMLAARKRDPRPLNWAAFALFATPPGRREAGVAQGRAHLVLEDAAREVTRDGGRVPAGRPQRLRVEGDRDPPRAYRYLVSVDAQGRASPPRAVPAQLELEPPFGTATLLLLEADRPLGYSPDPDDATYATARVLEGGSGTPPRTLAGLAALFRLEDPALRLRILQLQVEVAAPSGK